MATMMMTEQQTEATRSAGRGDADSDRITPYGDLDPDYRAVIEKIRRLADLPDGWDSYGSRTIQPEAVAGAATVLVSASHSRMPAPFVAPVSGGGLQFEWNLEGCDLEIEALPDGRLRYLLCPEDESEAEGPIAPNELPGMFGRALRRELVAA